MSTEYVTHIPKVGNHGLLVSEKHDKPWCEYLRERLDNGTYKDQGYTDSQLARYEARAVDANGLCGCLESVKGAVGGVAGTGGVFSVLMSLPIREDVVDDEIMMGWQFETSIEEHEEAARDSADWNNRVREVYIANDVSLASEESYDTILSATSWW